MRVLQRVQAEVAAAVQVVVLPPIAVVAQQPHAFVQSFVIGDDHARIVAILLVKLSHLAAWTEALRRHAADYDTRFRGTVVGPRASMRGCCSVFNQYVIRTAWWDELRAHLAERGIGTGCITPCCICRSVFRSPGYTHGDFSEAERAAREVLALPVYPELSEEMREQVAGSVVALLLGGKA